MDHLGGGRSFARLEFTVLDVPTVPCNAAYVGGDDDETILRLQLLLHKNLIVDVHYTPNKVHGASNSTRVPEGRYGRDDQNLQHALQW